MENTLHIGALVVLGVIVVAILSSIRVAKEHERFAIFVLGRFLR
jgi:regulator of protease activity HflC (stomatin/prohibitin superfamily)